MNYFFRFSPSKLLILVPFSLFFLPSSHATHLMGGDLSYECISTNSTSSDYKVTLKVYRDCNGVNVWSYEVMYISANCGTGSQYMTKVSSADITPTCNGVTGSACNGGSGTYGIEVHVYETTINIPASCSNIEMYWRRCCRNGAITTLATPMSERMYIETVIPDASVCNNSPVFLNSPVPFVCSGQPTNYNHGASDPDGDDLVFSLTDCLNNDNDPVTYASGFSSTNPLTTASGLTIDVETGAISFTPTVANQIGVLCVLVEEYRNGVKISEIMRDIQFTVLGCANNSPTATGMDGTNNFSAILSVGSPLSFYVNSDDLNSGDLVTMTWNNGISGATYSINSSGPYPSGTFSWTPTANDVGVNSFNVIVSDDYCPIVGQNTFTFDITVILDDNFSNTGGTFSDPSIWTNNTVPSSSENVYIQHDVTIDNDFTVDEGSVFEVDPGVTITVDDGSVLTVDGDFNNYGTIEGDVVIEGDAAVFVRLGDCENVEINNATNVLEADGCNISGVLTLTDGNFSSNNTEVILDSDVNGDAMIVTNGGTTLGDFTIRKYIQNTAGHHFLSSPMASATINELADDFPIQLNVAHPSLYYYDETDTDIDYEVGWLAPSSLSHPMTPGHGFTAWFDATNGVYIDMVGDFSDGNITVSLYNTYSGPQTGSCPPDGWNLLGNPYPSPLDFDLMMNAATTSTDIESGLYVWNPSTVNYASYVDGVSSPAAFKNIIPSMQSFWVRTTADVTFEFNNSFRVTDPDVVLNPFYKNTSSNNPLLRLEISGQGMNNEAVFRFKDNATANFDSKYDARFLSDGQSGTVELASASNEGLLQINTLPALQNNEVVIPLFTDVKTAGMYQFDITQFDNFGIKDKVFIEDNVLGVSHELITPYSFSSLTNSASNRFSLRVIPDDNTSVNEIENRNFKIYKSNDMICVNLPQVLKENKILNIYNSIGQVVFTTNLQAGQQNYHLEMYNLEDSNIYIIELQGYDTSFKLAW